jgi:hypothetical protein
MGIHSGGASGAPVGFDRGTLLGNIELSRKN